MSSSQFPLSTQAVANSNNDGVACLTRGDEAGAWVHFRNALMSASDPCISSSRATIDNDAESAPLMMLEDDNLRSAATSGSQSEPSISTMSTDIQAVANSKKRQRQEASVEDNAPHSTHIDEASVEDNAPHSTHIDRVRMRRFAIPSRSDAAQGSCITISPSAEGLKIQKPEKLAATKYTSSAMTSLIFARGIKIPTAFPEQHCFSSEPAEELSICVSIAVFNLALAYHLRGIQEGEEGSCKELFLSRALALYEKCSDMLLVPTRVAAATLTSTNNSVIDLLFMALFNNIAQISFEQMNYKDCRHYAGMLLQFISSINTTNYRDQKVAAFMQRVVVTFCLNSLALRSPTAARAA